VGCRKAGPDTDVPQRGDLWGQDVQAEGCQAVVGLVAAGDRLHELQYAGLVPCLQFTERQGRVALHHQWLSCVCALLQAGDVDPVVGVGRAGGAGKSQAGYQLPIEHHVGGKAEVHEWTLSVDTLVRSCV
jgi:hypothetical protein